MSCTNPLYAYQLLDNGLPLENQKINFVCYKEIRGQYNGNLADFLNDTFPTLTANVDYRPLIIPCGKCVSCRLSYARQWALRGLMELKSDPMMEASFITLTFDDEHLPKDGCVNVRDLQLFIKNLRRRLEPLKIRYLACGEYGSEEGRPHYHLIIFGWQPTDLVLEKVNEVGDKVYVSKFLESIWEKGIIYVGSVTANSIAYVAGYVSKKQEFAVSRAATRYTSPFIVMSRRPGLGYKFFSKYIDDFQNDSIHIGTNVCQIPRAFMKKCKEYVPEFFEKIKADRVKIAEDLFENTYSTPRLAVRDEIATIRFNKLQRNL